MRSSWSLDSGGQSCHELVQKGGRSRLVRGKDGNSEFNVQAAGHRRVSRQGSHTSVQHVLLESVFEVQILPFGAV